MLEFLLNPMVISSIVFFCGMLAGFVLRGDGNVTYDYSSSETKYEVAGDHHEHFHGLPDTSRDDVA